MKVVVRDLWLCVDCTVFAVNGEHGDYSPRREREIESGLERLGPHLVPDDYDEDQAECSNCGWHGPSSQLVDVYTDPEYPDWTEEGCPNCKATDDVSTRDNGRLEYSNCGCDCCGSSLAGSFTRFAILGEEDNPQTKLNF